MGERGRCGGIHVVDEATMDKLLAEIDAKRAERAKQMPTAQDALRQVCEAKERLQELGWRDGIYAPKDGSMFRVIEAGSTGIFEGSYSGEWPDGYWYTYADGDVYPSRSPPFMFAAPEQPESK